eukprot:1972107-Amphidinium_carterae.1
MVATPHIEELSLQPSGISLDLYLDKAFNLLRTHAIFRKIVLGVGSEPPNGKALPGRGLDKNIKLQYECTPPFPNIL